MRLASLLMAAAAGAGIAGSAIAADTAPPPVTAPIATPPAVAPQPMICKSQLETGSLVKRTKTCFTRKQWNYVNEQHEREARKLVEDGTGRPGSN